MGADERRSAFHLRNARRTGRSLVPALESRYAEAAFHTLQIGAHFRAFLARFADATAGVLLVYGALAGASEHRAGTLVRPGLRVEAAAGGWLGKPPHRTTGRPFCCKMCTFEDNRLHMFSGTQLYLA